MEPAGTETIDMADERPRSLRPVWVLAVAMTIGAAALLPGSLTSASRSTTGS